MIGNDEGIVVMICVFIFIYANTTGPIAWVYSAETCTDVGLGVCLLTLWAVVLLEVLTVPTLMNTPIETSGVFFVFAIFGIISAVFVFFFLKETKGLTDQEKRNLYAPKVSTQSKLIRSLNSQLPLH